VASSLELVEAPVRTTDITQAEMVQAVVDSEINMTMLQVHLALRGLTQLIV